MSQFVLPKASSKRFHSLKTKEEKDKFILEYKSWRNHPFTKDLMELLESELEHEIEKEDSKNSFMSKFEFGFSTAFSRGKRSLLRKLIKQI